MKRIWVISDTHGNHGQLEIPKGVDAVIHCGDSTNHHGWIHNQPEFENFYNWFIYLPIYRKVLIAGNHDAWATKRYNIDRLKEAGVVYLEHEFAEVDGIKIFGSPYTPTYGEWHFMKSRETLDRWWRDIPEGLDVLVTHGPPKGILDLSRNYEDKLEYCGDGALLKHALNKKPKYHCFGHIHNFKDCKNQGIRIFEDVTFINASVVEDGKMGQITSNGIIINI